MSNIFISYGDITPNAKENFEPFMEDKASFVDVKQIQSYSKKLPNYSNPCELYSVALDGLSVPLPENAEKTIVGLWSNQMTNGDGVFETPIMLELVANKKYYSKGFSFTFNNYDNIYCTRLKIAWYEDGVVIDEKEFEPTSAIYFCQNPINSFDKLVFTFYSLNMPYNRLVLRSLDFGEGIGFEGKNLRSIKIGQQIDPISTSIEINTCDFTLEAEMSEKYSFQSKQPIMVYFNDELKSTTFIRTAKRTAENLYQITSEDYINVLENMLFVGGVYERQNAVALIKEILDTAHTPYTISSVFDDVIVSGHIPYTTCREALMQVAFAIGAVVDTSNSSVVEIYPIDEEIKQEIPLNRIMQGQNFDDKETVTSVELTSHQYEPSENEREIYNAEKNGVGDNIFIKLTSPMHSFSIENGEILRSGANFVVINALDGCKVKGKQYEHKTFVKSKKNPELDYEIENIVAINNATLVSALNVDERLNVCYNWLTRRKETRFKVIEGKHVKGGEPYTYGSVKYGAIRYGEIEPKTVIYDEAVNVGNVIVANTAFLGKITGIITSQNYNLNGGIIVKDVVLK